MSSVYLKIIWTTYEQIIKNDIKKERNSGNRLINDIYTVFCWYLREGEVLNYYNVIVQLYDDVTGLGKNLIFSSQWYD